MSSGRDAGSVQSFWPRSSPWLTGASWLLAAGVTATQWQQHGLGGLLRVAPWAVGAGYLAWLVFWRPRVRVTEDAVVVVNPFRTVRVPFAALVDVSTQFALTLVTPHVRVRAWAAPGPGRHKAFTAGPDELDSLPVSSYDARKSVRLGDLRGSASGTAGELVRARWQHLVETEALELGVADTTPVDTRWDRTAQVALSACVVLGVVAQLV
jgi:hypothetical protein